MARSPSDSDITGILPHLDRLKRQGIILNETEVWILLACRNDYLSVRQMADLKGMTYQGIYSYINKLVSLAYLEATSLGREKYYKSRIDLRELIEDDAIRVEYKNQWLTFEEIAYYLSLDIPFMGQYEKFIRYCLGQIYYRAYIVAEGKTPVGPSTEYVLGLITSLTRAIEDELNFLRQLAQLPVSIEDRNLLDRLVADFKGAETHDKLMLDSMALRSQIENKHMDRNGLTKVPLPKEVAKIIMERGRSDNQREPEATGPSTTDT